MRATHCSVRDGDRGTELRPEILGYSYMSPFLSVVGLLCGGDLEWKEDVISSIVYTCVSTGKVKEVLGEKVASSPRAQSHTNLKVLP